MTPPDVWVRHRKLCKKRASAKWYAKKKQREIEEQNTHRQQLEHEYQLRTFYQPVFTPQERAYHRVVLAHLRFGYPPRPDSVPVSCWDAWKDYTEEGIELTRHTFPHWRWSEAILSTMRRLGVREWYEASSFYSPPARRTDSRDCGDAPDVAFWRLRHQRLRCHEDVGAVLTGPLGWLFARLHEQQLSDRYWSHWIPSVRAIQASHPTVASPTKNPMNGYSTSPIAIPNPNDQAENPPLPPPFCSRCQQYHTSLAPCVPSYSTASLMPRWVQHPESWDRLVEDFEDWLKTQPPSPERDYDHDTSSLESASQDSLDSSVVRAEFLRTEDNERPTGPGHDPAHSKNQPPIDWLCYDSNDDEEYDSDCSLGHHLCLG